MSFLCKVDSDAVRAVALDEAVRDRIATGDLFYTPHDENVLEDIRSRCGTKPGPLLDSTGRHEMVWVASSATKRAHVRRYKLPKEQTDGFDQSRDGAHEWVQYCLFRLGRRCRAAPAIEVPFGGGYRADVVWFSYSLCLEVDLTPNSSNEQRNRFEAREKEGWDTVALMDTGDANGTHVDLPRLLVRNLKSVAKEAAGGERGPYEIEQLFVDNVSSLQQDRWVDRSHVTVGNLLSGIARGGLEYRELAPGRNGLKGSWAWVTTKDLREFEKLEHRHLRERQRLARMKELKGKRRLLLVESQRADEKVHIIETLDLASVAARNRFLALVSTQSGRWPRDVDLRFIEAVRHLAPWWRRWFDWGGRLRREANERWSLALDSAIRGRDAHRTRLAEVDRAVKAIADEAALDQGPAASTPADQSLVRGVRPFR